MTYQLSKTILKIWKYFYWRVELRTSDFYVIIIMIMLFPVSVSEITQPVFLAEFWRKSTDNIWGYSHKSIKIWKRPWKNVMHGKLFLRLSCFNLSHY